ncbi:serine hydrolase domain-containing protein [Nonomuraea rhizosphaerae]|uniref:serine hydrolase domain-containing protein n=1 Tax=Nonomuraea rhizosphaerae TaxID=2665663 RepID=UPI001C5F8923|nr:serine hydrolase domain-containing protein [Nonomuraea rhizosphaerae]
MTLHDLLQPHIDNGSLPGAVALVAHDDQIDLAAVGSTAINAATPMTPDSIFRLASITKPITAAAVMILIEDGHLTLDAPIHKWLPELATPMVVRTPTSEIDDVIPAARPITVRDLLTSTAGYGFASDFSLPAVQRLFPVQRDGREVRSFPHADAWLAELAEVPLLYQPGEAYLYDTCSTIQGVLISRASGQSLPDFLAERVFEPLGMVDTAFEVPAAKRDRFTSYYRTGADGGLELGDGPDGQWSSLPAFPLGNGGLAGTAYDWLAFARMLLAGGVMKDGRRLLSAESVRLMTSDHTTPAQRGIGELFLEGQGWGFGGSVDIAPLEPWNVPGRYGWVGGTGTSAHIIPSTGSTKNTRSTKNTNNSGKVTIFLAQVGTDSPVPSTWMQDFWRYAATAE